MIKPIESQKLIFKLVLIILSFYITCYYLLRIVQSDLKGFVFTTSAPILVALGVITGLGFSWASILPESNDRRLIALASEKMFHSTLLFSFAILIGTVAIEIGTIEYWKIFFGVIKYLITMLGITLLFMSFQAALYGVDWLGDTLYDRWNRRVDSVDNITKTALDRLEMPKGESIDLGDKEETAVEEVIDNQKISDKIL